MMYAETSLHSSPHGQQDRLADKEDLRKQFTGHLTKEDFDYFSGWDRLIDLEAHAGQSLVAEAWLTPSETIEKDTGKCLSNLVFEKCNSVPDIGLRDFSFADISFKRSEQSPLQTPLSHLGLEPGCNAIISVDRTTVSESRPAGMPLPRMHIVRGILHRVSDTTVTVKASRDDLVRVQRVASSAPVHTPLTFRIDRDSIATGTGTLRQNLINFFTGDTVKTESGKSVRWPTRLPMLRDIVVRGRTPIFLDEKTKMMFTPDTRGSPLLEAPPGCDFMDLAVEFAEMNPDQKAAIQKVCNISSDSLEYAYFVELYLTPFHAPSQVMAAQECSLIQGLPGTGKSEVISFIARLLAAHGKRVLISAYTHSAVDNVMMKLLKKGLSVTSQTWPTPALVRVGRTSSCHPDVRFLLVSETAATLEPSKGPACSVLPSAEHLRTVMKTARVVGATALSVPRSPLLLGEHFDVVIVDEAGQISQPAVLGALMAAESFVLVGDHMQLPPLVTSELAAEGGKLIAYACHLSARSMPDFARLILR